MDSISLPVIHCVKSFLTLLFGLLSANILLAQQLQQDSVSYADTTKVREEKADPILENPIPWSIFIEASAEYAPQPDEHNFHQQLAIGASYRMINIGAFVNLQKKTITKTLIFPNQFDLIYLHGGGYLGLTLINGQQADLVLRYNFSKGGMVWENAETKADLVRDDYYMSKPELVFQYRLLNFISFFASGGYKLGHGIEMPGINKNDFNGFTISVGGRLGFFLLNA
ncbi:MAG: hypothetical protein RLQ12_19915 [Cyclobacteriaceae bacterium]